MPTPEELEAKLWAGLRSEMTVMLGMVDESAPSRPMTAQFEDDEDHGPLWFFTSQDSELVQAGGGAATAVYTAKGHDLFARVEGRLTEATTPGMIDRLWNPFVAAWYDGKDDPDIALLRMDLESAKIWENASSLMAGIKALLGVKPQQDYKDKVAEVPLD
ncbi:pyridoxamine 5'-phosphate oxidase family protein [Tabrizicola sp.]|uniref:pyridoxamine 5'-phosphate oxidase family protein n=1 Tax=Tabrizicola sp. TaxID=2005166 RepID=UPI0035B096AC